MQVEPDAHLLAPVGALAEWIRLYRRADAEPAPAPTATAVDVPPLPAAESASDQGSPLLPSDGTLRYGTLPLTAVTVAAIMVMLGLTAAAKRFRLARESRTPSRPPT